MAVATWDGLVFRNAVRLAELARRGPHGGDVRVPDLEVAVTARAAVLAGAAGVMWDLAPTGRDAQQRRPEHLHELVDRHPVRALGILLQDRGRPTVSRSPSELLDASAPGSVTTRHWAAAGRDALIADRIWTSLPRQLDGHHAWHVVRQVAALVELVAVLDRGLARTASAAARPDLVSYLHRTAGIAVVAREVRSLADATPGAAEGHAVRTLTIKGPEPRHVIQPTDGKSAAAALRRLTTQIKTADALAPNHVRIVATLARDLSVLAAKAGAESSGRPLRDHLGELAVTLNQIVAGRHGEAMLAECRQPVLEHQARELSGYTRAALGGRAPLPDIAEASRLASRLPTLLNAVSDKAREQVDLRRWAIPNRIEESHLRYTIATTQYTDRMPRMLRELDRARAVANALPVIVGAPRGGDTCTAKSLPPTVPLDPLWARGHLVRPAHPAAPPREHLPPAM